MKESQSVHLTKILVPAIVGAVAGVLIVIAVMYFLPWKAWMSFQLR